MVDQTRDDASSTSVGEIAVPHDSFLPQFASGLTVACLALAIFACHLYYLDVNTVWPLAMTGALVLGFGGLAKRWGAPPKHPGYASFAHVLFGASAIVFICVALLLLQWPAAAPPAPNIPSTAAMDDKIDRLLDANRVDPPVLAVENFGGLEEGSEVLDCDGTTTRLASQAILDAAKVARDRGQRFVLLLVGMTDRRPLTKVLALRYGSNAGLATARAEAVRACLRAARVRGVNVSDTIETIRLTTGPTYLPQSTSSARVEALEMAKDRQVRALLFSVPESSPVRATAPADTPPRPPSVPAVHRPATVSDRGKNNWHWVLLLLGWIGLLVAVAMQLRVKDRHGTPAAALPKVEPIPSQLEAEALTHVRDMHEMFAELRTKNFNFFIVIVAATIAGAAGLNEKTNSTLQFISSLAAALTCIIFYGIEKRTVEMLGDARQELERLEGKLGVYLNRRDKWVGGLDRRRYVTHTSLYMAAFLIVYFGALISIRVHYPW